jgi:hypothetical protein
MEKPLNKNLIHSTHEKPAKRAIRLPSIPLASSKSRSKRNRTPLTAAQKDIRNQINELKVIISKKVGKGMPNFNEMKNVNPEGLNDLIKVQKPGHAFKKTRFKKTKFKVPRNMQNVKKLQDVICGFVDTHKNLKNDVEKVNMKEYDKNSPFIYGTFDFVDEIMKDNNLIRDRFGYNEKNLSKNKLLLEKVLLTRLVKREENLKKIQSK